jgi:hypothetical protein
MQTITNSLTTKKAKINKLVLGFVGIAATTIIGTAGIAAAQQTRDLNMPNPPSKAACAEFSTYGFKNRGQCVSWWEHHNNPGHGYGGGSGNSTTNNVSTNVDLDVKGDNNVISVVINYFFGH